MKKRKILYLILVMLILVISLQSINMINSIKEIFSPINDDYILTIKKDIASLMMAYPGYIVDLEVIDIDNVYLILSSGEKILYDDGKEKIYAEELANPDLQDMLAQVYKLGPVQSLMPEDYNPGRIRVYPLLKEVYGLNQYEIEKNLIGININSIDYPFNENNYADYHLKSAIKELNSLATGNPNLWRFLYPISGTYNFRYISGTNRLSPHALGIAIDFASHEDDYWQWTTREAGENRLKSFPQAIVDVMEENYFIWGGKWGQFDIFHFEYRPEIIIKSKYFSDSNTLLWYENLPIEDRNISEIVSLIEDKLLH